ncbi:uncharacterized protein LOC124403417 [Silurus meridionalis]|uniref:uncharacterized protein LOC124403417 n=1 Tax=Silurus meridionalis TaxID=175797 RepID=UPI001EE9BAB3|nr:uncharacterized protein LOC124403417 [Silurus meridionalis]
MAKSHEMKLRLISEQKVFRVVKSYTEEFSGSVENGDVFIVQHEKVLNAGVYCAEDTNIIQLKKMFGFRSEVRKVNVDGFTRGKKFAVYRKNDGITDSFKESVNEAMSRGPEYNVSTYNCIEFIMDLLEVDLKPTFQDCNKIGLGTKPRSFRVVKKFSDKFGNAKLGDLFIVKCGFSGTGYYHAGVCCCESGQEIIHFTPNYPGSFGLSAAVTSLSTSCRGLVSKVHIKSFSSHSKFAVYRKKTGISASFQTRVDEAMSQSQKYQLLRYNCIHFALELFYGGLEERNILLTCSLIFSYYLLILFTLILYLSNNIIINVLFCYRTEKGMWKI